MSSNISLIADMQSMINSGMAVVYWPVGETLGICCNECNIHQLLFYTVHMLIYTSGSWLMDE